MGEYERWEGRYSAPEYIFGEAPNYFLAACKSLLPANGKALAVADGEGRNGVWLAEQGLDVLSVDFSPNGQAKARKLAAARGVSVRLEQADVHTWPIPLARSTSSPKSSPSSAIPDNAGKMGWHEARAEERRIDDHSGLYAQATRIRHRRPKGA